MENQRQKELKFIKFFLLALYLLLSGLLLFYPLPDKINYKYSRIVESENGRVLRITLSEDDKFRIKSDISEVSPLFLKTLLLKEDKRFFFHPGVDIIAVLRAVYNDLKAQKIVQGASTISMQTARMLEPKKRNIISKIKESLRAFQFEIILGKRKILETYINTCPYGKNIEGIYSASLIYFRKKPSELLPDEIAILIALPREPSLISNEKKLILKARKILTFMYEKSLINRKEYNKAIKRLHFPEINIPFYMPHGVEFVLEKSEDERIITTFSLPIYEKVMKIVKSYKPYFERNGAKNISVCVIDYKKREVKVLIGSFSYFDNKNGGKIKGFNIRRSTGSTLKPFIYAKAIDMGLINPESLLEDFPKRFGAFMPKNFDKKFRGLVRAEDALSLSLNIPFVFLLKRVGIDEFESAMKNMGVKAIDFSRYGLTVSTGGIELTLLELIKLYYVLRSGGLVGNIKILRKEEIEHEKRIYSMGSVYLTLKALSKRNRPDALFLENFKKKRVYYWKTGTSWGRRDAWSIGFGKKYIVGVWGGNFSGEGSSGIYGANLAAPVMFDILDLLEEKDETGELEWFWKARREIEYVDVCSFSGYIPQENCNKTKKAQMLKKKHTTIVCPYHKKVIIERKTGFRACPDKKYRPGELEERVFLDLPPEVNKVLGKKGMPNFSPDCKLLGKGELHVESPIDGKTYFLFSDIKGASGIVFRAFSKSGKIYWFVNGKYVGESSSGENFLYFPKKKFLIITADDTRMTRTVKIKIIKK